MGAEAPSVPFDLGTRNLLIMSGVYKQRRGRLTVPSQVLATFSPIPVLLFHIVERGMVAQGL